MLKLETILLFQMLEFTMGSGNIKWRVNDGTDYNQGGLIPIPNDKFRSVADIDFDIMKFKSINESNDEFLRFLKDNAENAKVEKLHMFVLKDSPEQLINLYNQTYHVSIKEGKICGRVYKQKDNLFYVKELHEKQIYFEGNFIGDSNLNMGNPGYLSRYIGVLQIYIGEV